MSDAASQKILVYGKSGDQDCGNFHHANWEPNVMVTVMALRVCKTSCASPPKARASNV
jgi:hypothetical protein